MTNLISVKSVVSQRVRLKSDIFKKISNIKIIEQELSDFFIYFRENKKCKSIIFTHKKEISLEEIINKIDSLFHNHIKHSTVASGIVCNSSSSCSSCAVREKDPKSFKRKLIEFGILSIYSAYLFVSESILGLTIVATPFSLVAFVSVIAAIPLIKESYEDIKQKKFTLQTFMSGTLILAILFGEATAAFEIIYILRGAMLLEDYIATKSKNEIHKLVELDIQKVFVLVDGIELEVDIDELEIGDIVVCRSGDKIPVDGVIVDGSCDINEALINGRSDLAFKKIDNEVFAGTLVERGRVSIKVFKKGNETYMARVMSDVENSLALKSPAQKEADKLAAKLLKLGTGLTIGTLLITGSWLSAFSVMIVMSCPCATVLAASTAISGGIASGAKQGILIKGGEALEQVSQAEVFCFDKTGTLTTGKPIIKDILTLKNITEDELLKFASIAEFRNSHPIAKSIVAFTKDRGIEVIKYGDSEIIPGFGVKTKLNGTVILVGNRSFMSKNEISTKEIQAKAYKHLDSGNSVVFVAVDAKLLGFIALNHEVRQGTKKMIDDLRKSGVKHIALISGDEHKVANAFAKEFDFDEVYANQTPDEKADAVLKLKKKYNGVVMVGDGVNDTLAMSKADVSVSFAAGGSQSAIEVSNIAISHSHPSDVVELYNISKKTLRVVNQNYWIGTSTNLVGVGFAMFGMLSPAAAGAIHIGHTAAIMANSSKLTWHTKENSHETINKEKKA